MSRNFRFRPNRRQLLQTTAGGAAAFMWPGTALTASPPTTAPGQRLGRLAAAKGLLFGASFAVHELDRPSGPTYADLYRHETPLLTSELALKLAILRPEPHRLDFAASDRLMAFAADNNKTVRGHTLIWDDGLPQWVHALSKDEVRHLLFSHILSVMERYKGRIPFWDVVNEPIAPWDKNPGHLRQGPFYQAFGEDYIAESFRLARAFDPAAKLFLNEAQTESNDENGETFRTSFLSLVRRLLDQGVPIDGVGFQSHLQSKRPYDFPKFAAYLQKFAELGLDIHITELDVNDSAFADAIPKRDQHVARMYGDFLSAVLQVPAVSAVILWQLSDATSWMADPNFTDLARGNRKPRPLPYDRDFKRKPAWDAIARSFADMPARQPNR
jgi:endo-1,4-beta-xylanase